MIFTRAFLTAAAERAGKAFCATLLAFLPAAGLNVVPELNWGDMSALSGYAALASLLLSVVSAPFGGTGPSLANEVISPPAVDPGPRDLGHSTVEVILISLLTSAVVIALWVFLR